MRKIPPIITELSLLSLILLILYFYRDYDSPSEVFDLYGSVLWYSMTCLSIYCFSLPLILYFAYRVWKSEKQLLLKLSAIILLLIAVLSATIFRRDISFGKEQRFFRQTKAELSAFVVEIKQSECTSQACFAALREKYLWWFDNFYIDVFRDHSEWEFAVFIYIPSRGYLGYFEKGHASSCWKQLAEHWFLCDTYSSLQELIGFISMVL